MVVMDLPATADTGVMHERNGAPSTCTVQAPHWAIPQPNLVPVKCTTSRSTQSKGMSSGTSNCCVAALMVSVSMTVTSSAIRAGGLRFG
ncbi:hypothetical protein D3C80_1931720 [compost metagenome]